MTEEKTLIAILCILVIIIVALILGSIFYFTNNDITYAILLTDGEIPVGNNITLIYEIKNGIFAPSVSDIDLDIWVYHLNATGSSSGLLHYYVPIDVDLNREGGVEGQVAISAYHLDVGEYTIYTTLRYTTDGGYYKQLETEFEIY